MKGRENAFCWIREELHSGESINSISAEGFDDEEVRTFVLTIVKSQYDESLPVKKAIDSAEAKAREFIRTMDDLNLRLGGPPQPKEPRPWRRHIRLVEVIYHPDSDLVEEYPEHMDLVTLARSIESGSVHGLETIAKMEEIPTAVAKALIGYVGVQNPDEIETPPRKGD